MSSIPADLALGGREGLYVARSFSPSEWFGSAAVYPGNELLRDGMRVRYSQYLSAAALAACLVRSGAGSDCSPRCRRFAGFCAALAISHRKTAGTYAQWRVCNLRHATFRSERKPPTGPAPRIRAVCSQLRFVGGEVFRYPYAHAPEHPHRISARKRRRFGVSTI